MAGGTSIGSSPRLDPRPDYTPVRREVLVYTLTELIRYPALCTLTTVATRGVYSQAYAAQTWRQWWAAGVTVSPIAVPGWVESDDLFFTLALLSSLSLIYILCNGLFWLLETTGLCAQYKVPRKPAQEPPPALIRAALLEQAINHLIMAPLLMLFVVGPALRWRNPDAAQPQGAPGWAEAYCVFTVCYVLNDIEFYFAHRLLHSKALYGPVHKQHHQFVGTRSFAAEHAHPIEDVLSAYIPFLTGIAIMGAHFHLVFVWFFVRMTEVYESHSGYIFRGSWLDKCFLCAGINPPCHDFHHTGNRGNFGHPLLDYCCGTMDAWVAMGGADGYAKKLKKSR
eukprot:m.204262 g.204262  ORF g.204262 m.204262 type:complete len:338 (+) comp15381_c1_seq4:430-1443(+)